MPARRCSRAPGLSCLRPRIRHGQDACPCSSALSGNHPLTFGVLPKWLARACRTISKNQPASTKNVAISNERGRQDLSVPSHHVTSSDANASSRIHASQTAHSELQQHHRQVDHQASMASAAEILQSSSVVRFHKVQPPKKRQQKELRIRALVKRASHCSLVFVAHHFNFCQPNRASARDRPGA